MSAYRFRLEPVRRLREARRDELRGQLADAFRAAEVVSGERQKVLQELRVIRAREQAIARDTNLSISSMVEHQRYELVLQGQAAALAEKLKLVEDEVERRRQLVAEADREVRTLDKLEDRQRETHRVDQQRAEAKAMDATALELQAIRRAGGKRQ
ncbi:flagellar biosynthesis chaperone [Posidoniimonas polymericola]|uniref:Flagellar biosynthesis chaperone n=1 Tax=Posidoniimonas polymericola TaxID=2528002 RepID=A0A5C5YR34_9BACT|nr:flagellar FliJ family protein [Posidoniimonas polymericola]TWT77220.1 flagellar biosynthesis chaperone [Posidoniimonas polymericola]